MGACTNASDTGVVTSVDIAGIVGTCAQQNLNFGPPPSLNEPATLQCIKAGTAVDGGPGLSDACAACFDAAAQCTVAMCLTECLGGTMSPSCVMCRQMKCDPAFQTCSGLPPG
jgi:hypothetical protein